MFDSVCIFFISFAASFLCVATGGAGLIVTPSLILLGQVPQVAVATDMFGMLGSSSAAFRRFRALGMLRIGFAIRVAVVAMSGVLLGVHFMSVAKPDVLRLCVMIAMLVGTFLLLFKGNLGGSEVSGVSLPRRIFGYLLLFVSGLWGGSLGGGFLLLATFALLLCFGRTLLHSAAVLTLLSITVGVVATVSFASRGLINYELGVFVMLGKSLGAHFGVPFAATLDSRIIKWLFSAITLFVALKLL